MKTAVLKLDVFLFRVTMKESEVETPARSQRRRLLSRKTKYPQWRRAPKARPVVGYSEMQAEIIGDRWIAVVSYQQRHAAKNAGFRWDANEKHRYTTNERLAESAAKVWSKHLTTRLVKFNQR